jgi:hypothetical protein
MLLLSSKLSIVKRKKMKLPRVDV